MTGKAKLCVDGDAGRRDPWSVIHDAVFAGLNHALSNRVMGLVAFMTIAERRGTVDWSDLMAEHARCERLLQLYRLLEVLPGELAEPMHVSEPLADAIDLLGHHLGLRDIAVEIDPAPAMAVVSLPRRRATRAFLVLLHEAARRADGASARVHWHYALGADEVTVVATVRPGTEADADCTLLMAAPALVGGVPEDVRCILDPGHSYHAELRLPLLRAGSRP